MKIDHLSLKNFRNYARLEVTLPTGALLLHGQNAQGKTSFLEAIYYLATSSSPYTTSDKQLINWNTEDDYSPFTRIAADVLTDNAMMHQIAMTLVRESANRVGERFKKEVRLNNVKKKRSDIIGLVAVVMFLPQDLMLVEGSPQHRRRYMDATLAQVDAHYIEAVHKFDKTLTQRNALLRRIQRNQAGEPELEFWDQELTKSAAVIIAGRQRFLREIENQASYIYRDLTGQLEDLKIAYVPSFEPTAEGDGQLSFSIPGLDLHRQIDAKDIVTQYQDALAAIRTQEIERGITLIGPQRDEIRFMVNGRDLGLYGSRGQARTAVLAIKLAELAWMNEKIGEYPILLLDEVASELDEHRRAYLLDQIKDVPQAILTTTEPSVFTQSFLNEATQWKIHAGQIIEA